MQVIEKFSEGLKRELDVIVPSSRVTDVFDKRIEDIKSKANIKGFRPGKVPVSHIKSMYGKSILSEIIDEMIKEIVPEVLSQRDERAAMRPNIAINEGEDDVTSRLIEGSVDLKIRLLYDVLPKIEIDSFDDLQITQDVCEVSEEEIDKQMVEIAKNNLVFEVKEKQAEIGDQVNIDYTVSADNTILKDHSKKNLQCIVGSEALFSETTDMLIGLKAGDKKEIERLFPEDHSIKDLAGKKVILSFSINAVSSPLPIVINNDLAVRLDFESETAMRDLCSQKIKQHSEFVIRQKVKRQVLDYISNKYTFDVPESLVENEYNSILQKIRLEMNASGQNSENADPIKEEDVQDYRMLANRRVLTGIVLGTIGEKNSIDVTEEEMQSALYQQLQRFPGHEKKMLEYFQKHPNAVAELRAPIFEEKVIDCILKNAQIIERKVTVDQLFKDSAESSKEELSEKSS
ncbi:trigger factor [Candidatus Liberibacter africanus]|uniref:Trigger factor n=1 Tax=Candidatus Liberibacter africanus PTSAPSY TaxID=1277257 RepID=A0A0G3I9I6_LIBAF|nr:trigger factor [Candidatus Liberibacter africanus]AKK20427.1 trigger factor [Candidatus Liberibacter africanus PTSAPSY]